MPLALSMTQNKTGVFFLSVYQADGVTPQSLVGAVLQFNVKYYTFTIAKSSSTSGITITNTAGGANCATLQIEPADTGALAISPGCTIGMLCGLTLLANGEAYELNSGILRVTAAP